MFKTFRAALFMKARRGKNPHVHQWISGDKTAAYLYQWNIARSSQELKLCPLLQHVLDRSVTSNSL